MCIRDRGLASGPERKPVVKAIGLSEQDAIDLNFLSEYGVNAVSYTHLDVYKRQERYIFLAAGTSCFTVTPFCLKFLNMSTVAEHNAAQVTGGKGRDNAAFETIFIQKWQTTRMIDMCVCQ